MSRLVLGRGWGRRESVEASCAFDATRRGTHLRKFALHVTLSLLNSSSL